MDAKEQIAIVREGLQTVLQENQIWCVVSCDWYARFKEYVNFDNDLGFQEEKYPGEISNLELVKEEESSMSSGAIQLQQNCIEGLDYFTLPKHHYDCLKAVYGSDIDIERQVIMVGKGAHSPGVAQIELNPIRVNVFVVKSEEDGTDEALKFLPPTACFQFSRQLSLSSAIQTILDKLALDPPPPYMEDTSSNSSFDPSPSFGQTPIRFWAKTCTTASNASSVDSGDDFMSSYRSCPALPTSFITDKTDIVGDYMFLRGLESTAKQSNFDEMVLENAVNMTKKQLDLVIEVGSYSSPSSSEIIWPRDNQLFKWTSKIASGDLIGASDKYKNWFEAVAEVVSDNSMLVHFKGWSKKFDETIQAKDYKTRLAPLYTKTDNWREKLKKGFELEVTKKVDVGGSKWLPGIVTEVDNMFDTVSVKYRQSGGSIFEIKDIALDSEQICPKHTHVSNEDWDFHNLLPENSTVAPVKAAAVTYSGGGNYYHSRATLGHQVGTPVVLGAVGLSNLGNTCFMNSTLQCLSNTPGLTHLFREDRHLAQVNYDNVLGHKGELAKVYGRLIKDMWGGQYTSLRPEEFKRSIGEFAPQFSGYQQHDSSELMMFLLDGLHEDMNRVLKKPAVEKIESKGRDDDLISAESWRRYLLRNDSELVDLCFGQLKSHVTCVGCGYQSVTFDEYSSLSLPLPMKTLQTFSILVYPLPLGCRPFKVSLEAKKDSTINELIALLVASPLYKKAVDSRKHTELGKRKKDNASSYLLVDADTLDTEKQMDVDGEQLEANVKISHSYSDIETLGDISIETETDHEESVVLVNNSRTTGEEIPLPPSPDSPFFHICSLTKNAANESNRILKTYDAKGTIHNISDTMLAAYEMPQEVMTNNYTSYNHYSSYSSKLAETPTYAYFDLLIGVERRPVVRPAYSHMNPSYSHNRVLSFKTSGNPIRITYETNVTTRKEMNNIIFEAVKLAYDLPEAYSPTRLPYTIHITSAYATGSKGVVNLTDDNSKEPFTLLTYDCLLCCWNDSALRSEAEDGSTDSGGDGITSSSVKVNMNGEEEEEEEIPCVDPLMVSRWLEDGINGTSEGNSGANQMKSRGMNVMQCFDKFVEREQMPAEETWYCPKCKQHLAPIKKFDIWSAPEILVVHLKRFQYSSRATFTYREKVNDLIDFPIEGLDLTAYVKSELSSNPNTPAVYDLYGVSEHSGTMGGGHYTAKCKNEIDGKWYSFNDSHVRECSPESAISSEAYVLFYKRRHGHLKWGGLIPSTVPMEN